MPLLHLVVGPNGAGKSSFVRDVLQPSTGLQFVNADEIAAEHWPESAQERAYEAAQLAAELRDELIERGTSFIAETVFSHESKVALVQKAVAAGYLVQVHVIMVPVELTLQRVLERVRRGGHSVPEEKIRARYERLWPLVVAAVQVADIVEVRENSSARAPFRLCALYEQGSLVGAADWPTWAPRALTGPLAGH